MSRAPLEVRRPGPRQTLGRNPARYVLLGVLLLSGFAQAGLWGGLGLLAIVVLCLLAVAVYTTRARLWVSRDAMAKRGFLRTRTVPIPTGARLVRVAQPGPHRWGTAEDHAIVVLADREDRALLRWSGRWQASPKVIARAAGLEVDDRLTRPEDERARALLPFTARHPWITGLAVAAVIVAAVIGTVVSVLGERDEERDRAAARMQAQVEAHVRAQSRTAAEPALRAAWREIARSGTVDVERDSPGPYADGAEGTVDVYLEHEDELDPATAGAVCRSVLSALLDPPLIVRYVHVEAAEERIRCDRRGVYLAGG